MVSKCHPNWINSVVITWICNQKTCHTSSEACMIKQNFIEFLLSKVNCLSCSSSSRLFVCASYQTVHLLYMWKLSISNNTKKWISSSGNYTKKLRSCTQWKYLVQVVHISLRITIEVLAPWSQGNKQFISKAMRMDTLDLSRWKTYCILQTLRFGHNKLCPQQLRIRVSRNHKYTF